MAATKKWIRKWDRTEQIDITLWQDLCPVWWGFPKERIALSVLGEMEFKIAVGEGGLQ